MGTPLTSEGQSDDVGDVLKNPGIQIIVEEVRLKVIGKYKGISEFSLESFGESTKDSTVRGEVKPTRSSKQDASRKISRSNKS